MERQTIQEMGGDAKLLIAFLEKKTVGEEISYADLSKVISADIRKRRGSLYTAFKVLRRDKRIVFGTVRKEGIKRLNDEGMLKSAYGNVRTIQRATRRGIKTLACLNYDNLPNNSKVEHNASLSMLGVIQQATTSSSMKRLENAVEKAHAQLPTADTLKLLAG
jgi:hypothetical protein